MAVTRKTITLTDQQDAWVKARVRAGDYTNDSEYVRDLIRRDQAANAKRLAQARAIRDGLDSGESAHSVRGVWDEAERRHRAKHG